MMSTMKVSLFMDRYVTVLVYAILLSAMPFSVIAILAQSF